MTASQITETLFQRYCRRDGWIAIAEVEMGDRSHRAIRRRVDFAALSFFRQNTCEVAEVKVSRRDFLNELKDPEKRKPAFENSSAAWFVCAPDVCEEPEVPEGWGYMLCDEHCHLHVVRKAPKRPLAGLTTRFVARFMERSSEPLPETCRVYLTLDGQTLGANEFQRLVQAEARKAIAKSSAACVLNELYRRCYDCKQAGNHAQCDGWTVRVHDKMVEWVERKLAEVQVETVLDTQPEKC